MSATKTRVWVAYRHKDERDEKFVRYVVSVSGPLAPTTRPYYYHKMGQG